MVGRSVVEVLAMELSGHSLEEWRGIGLAPKRAGGRHVWTVCSLGGGGDGDGGG